MELMLNAAHGFRSHPGNQRVTQILFEMTDQNVERDTKSTEFLADQLPELGIWYAFLTHSLALELSRDTMCKLVEPAHSDWIGESSTAHKICIASEHGEEKGELREPSPLI